MSFSLRLAPGLRVRVSSRGVRTSIGPRAARLHVGAGRPGFSTGAGPVGYYTPIGSAARSNRGARPAPGSPAVDRQLDAAHRAASKYAEAEWLREELRAIFDLHRTDFPAAQRPVAAAPAVDAESIRQAHLARARAGVSVFAFRERKAALARAEEQAAAEVRQQQAAAESARADLQRAYDQWWQDLMAGDPDVTLARLAAAFEDNEAAAAAVGIEGAEAALVVVVPAPDELPQRYPTATQAGNLSLKRFTKTEAAELYQHAVFGHMVSTVREAFAEAPALAAAQIVAVRATAPDAYGRRRVELLAAGTCARAALDSVLWADADSVQVFHDCFTEHVYVEKGVTAALQPIDPATEPGLAPLLERIDLADLLD